MLACDPPQGVNFLVDDPIGALSHQFAISRAHRILFKLWQRQLCCEVSEVRAEPARLHAVYTVPLWVSD
jgi:hypothetical protein